MNRSTCRTAHVESLCPLSGSVQVASELPLSNCHSQFTEGPTKESDELFRNASHGKEQPAYMHVTRTTLAYHLPRGELDGSNPRIH